MSRSRALLAVAVAALVTGTAATLDTAAAAPAPAPGGPTISPVVVLTVADNGRTVGVHPGDVVEVQLPPTFSGNVMWSWSFPQASDPAVLAVLPVPTPYGTGFFRATAPGRSTLTTVETCTPVAPGVVCSALGIRWSATVKVG